MKFTKKIIKGPFIILNIALVCAYLLTCLVPFLNAGIFWFVAIPGLAFPLMFFANLIFLMVWLLVRSRWVFLSLIAIVLSAQQLFAVFALHTEKPFTASKPANGLRVLQWNVSSWDEFSDHAKTGNSYRPAMFDEVKNSGSDICCFEEFMESRNTALFKPTIDAITKLGYPYHYYLPSYSELRYTELGMSIFSKYPIINTGLYDFGDVVSAQQLIYADIQFKNQIVRVFAIHLQSVRFGKKDYQSLEEIKHKDKTSLKQSASIIGKLRRAYYYRSQQAFVVRDFIDKSPYPVVLCGDFNDVPNSYTYFTIRGGLQDVFLKKGSGIGRTFRFISPTLRIDYILAGKKFKVEQYRRITVPYSDHYGIIGDISFDKQ